MSVEDDDSKAAINVDAFTSELVEQNSPEDCGVIADFDDDDFGNFEEATPRNAVENTAAVEKVHESTTVVRDTMSLLSLPEVLEQLNLRSTQTTSTKEGCDAEYDDDETDAFDFFCQFDICDSASPLDSEDVNLKNANSLELWSRLCNVEETNALNFLWSNSLAYLNFLRALRIKTNKSVGFRANYIGTMPNSTSAAYCNSGDGSANASGSELIDSLSVPPACFDWQTSGLSNPLTGSSMPAVHAVLACDYFNGESSIGQPCNGEAILKKELEALGLGDELPPNNIKTQLSVNIQKLIDRNSCNNSAGNSSRPCTSPSDASGHFKDQSNGNHDVNHLKAAENHRYGQAVGQRLAAAAADD